MPRKRKKQRKDNIELTPPTMIDDEESKKIQFSFRHVDLSDSDFSLGGIKKQNYIVKFVEKLKHLSSIEKRHLQNNADSHTHPIDWRKTSREETGFGFKGQYRQYDDYEPWQISITQGANQTGHGRIQGFFIGNTFYIRWFDANHKLYPRK